MNKLRTNSNLGGSFFSALLTSLFVMSLVSCEHKELDFTGVADLSVEFIWDNLPDANPSSMMLAAFAQGSQPVQKHLSGKNGGYIMLPEGNYSLIAYNSDTESFFTRGLDWENFEICANPTELYSTSRMFVGTRRVPRGTGTDDQEVIEEPDQLWTSATSGISVTGTVGRLAKMPMKSATVELNFTIKNVKNLEYINDVLATISGMSGSWLPAQHQCSEPLCIIPFELSAHGSSLSGKVRTFGYRQDEDVEHLLVIYTEMTDGSRLYYTFNVTETMQEASLDGNETIQVELDELPLPRPISNGTGLHPDVMDWQEISIDLPM